MRFRPSLHTACAPAPCLPRHRTINARLVALRYANCLRFASLLYANVLHFVPTLKYKAFRNKGAPVRAKIARQSRRALCVMLFALTVSHFYGPSVPLYFFTVSRHTLSLRGFSGVWRSLFYLCGSVRVGHPRAFATPTHPLPPRDASLCCAYFLLDFIALLPTLPLHYVSFRDGHSLHKRASFF